MLGDPDLVAAGVVLVTHRPPVGQLLGLLQQLRAPVRQVMRVTLTTGSVASGSDGSIVTVRRIDSGAPKSLNA